MARKRGGVRAQAAEQRLNLIPILNLVLMLIPAILITTAFVEMAVINVSAPQLPSSEATRADPPERLELALHISDRGVVITGLKSGDAVIPRGDDGRYDWARLSQKLAEIKDAHPEEERLVIRADSDVRYESVVEAMDAARQTADQRVLFPDVILSPGIS